MIAFLLSPLGKGVAIGAVVMAAFLGFRLWLHSHDTQLLKGYVLQVEADTAKAQAAEMERQRNAAAQALDETEKRRAAEEINLTAQEQKNAKEVADYETKLQAANRQCHFDRNDLDFLLHH